MSKNKKDIPMWAKTGHKKPVTRRDFLAAGLIPFAASVFVPSWASLLLGGKAHAADGEMNCDVADALVPVVTVNLFGGAALSSNFLPMNAAGDPISSYNKMGLGNNQVPILREFGNVPFAGMENGVLLSKFLVGVRAGAVASTIANTAFVAVPNESQNDTTANKLDISGLVTKAGLIGANLPNLGRFNSATGTQQSPALIPPPTPLIVSNFGSLSTSIGYTAAVAQSLNAKQRESLSKLMRDLNTTQTRKLAAIKDGDGIKKVLDCAGIKNVDVVVKGAGIIDPRGNTAFAQAWGVNAQTTATDERLISAAMVYNTILGQAGSSSLNLGGYDYHDQTRTTGDTKDQEAGTLVGRILQSAAILNKPVFVYVTSDGSVFSPESASRTAPWAGDRASNGVSYMLYYSPRGRAETNGFQIGSFTDNQGADTSFVTGGDPEKAALAVFANWCQINNRMDLLERVAGRPFDTNNLPKVLKFG